MKRIKLFRGDAIILCFVCIILGPMNGQVTRLPEQVSLNAPNAWMNEPTDLSVPDQTLTSIRFERDQVWDAAIGASLPLTQYNASGYAISEGSFLGKQPEILEFPNRAVLIGKFKSHRSVLTASRRAVYTEVAISVRHVFEDATGGATAGAQITLIFPGGTVKAAGETISYMTQPRHYFLQPGKTYVLILEYHKKGNFYGFGKDWDLSNGIVMPDSDIDRKRQIEGSSTLVGMKEQDLIRSLSERFAKSH